MNRRVLCAATILALALLVLGGSQAAHAQVQRQTHPPPFPLTPGPSPSPLSPPPADYDEQIGITFTQDFTSIAYNVTAVAQSDANGYGPAYLLNGLSTGGYWYQVGVSYDWPYLKGGHTSGFRMNYEVFDYSGNSVFPASGSGGLIAFSGTVNGGDTILLNLYFSNGTVTMLAQDWNTSAYASEVYRAYGDEFVGLGASSNGNGFFTGLMTEWYHVSPYYGGEEAVKYTDPSYPITSAFVWADEYDSSNYSVQFIQSQFYSFHNPDVLQSFSTNGTLAYADAYSFITGYLNEGVLTLSYSVTGGGSGYSPPVLTYTLDHEPEAVSLTTTPKSYFADLGTLWSVSSALPGGSTSERWQTNQETSGEVSSSLNVTLNYYHQVVVTFTSTYDSGLGLGVPQTPTVSYSQFGNMTITRPGTPVWVNVGSTSHYVDPIPGSPSGERWETPAPSHTIIAPGTIAATYYQQYALNSTYSIMGGGAPSHPELSGVQYGAPFDKALDVEMTTAWLDSGTAWSVTNPLGGSSSQERWLTELATSGTVNDSSTLSLTYFHQFGLNFSYAVLGGGSPLAPTVVAEQFGGRDSFVLGSAPVEVFLDSNSNWIALELLPGSSSQERWVAVPASNGTVTGATPFEIGYQHQYYASTLFQPSDGGNVTELTGWHDSGSVVQISANASAGWQFEGWVGSGSGAYSGPQGNTSATFDGPIVENATFYPGLRITAGSDGGVGYSAGSQSGDVAAGTTRTVYFPAGSTVSLKADPSSVLYQFERWTPSSTGSAPEATVRLDSPATVQASFSLNYLTIGGITGGIVVVVLVAAFVFLRRSRRVRI